MDRKRKYPDKSRVISQNKIPKLKPQTRKAPPLDIIDSSTDSDEEIPETPSASQSSSTTDPEQSMINLIEEYSSGESTAAHGATARQLEKSLIQEIESDTSLENEDHYATTLIESDSDATTSQGTRNLHRSVTKRHSTTPSTKDPVDIPFLANPPEHPLTVIAKRPKPLRNGLAQELGKILLDYRSKENFWQYDNKLGIGDPDTEVVLVKSIKKFHSHCLLVDIQRGGEAEKEEQILLHLNWDSCFRKLQAGDELMVNFRKTEPKLLNGNRVHFFPFARRQMDASAGAPK